MKIKWLNPLKNLRTNILAGMLILIPIGLTFYIVRGLLSYFDNLITDAWAPGVGIIVLLLLAWMVGIAAKNYFGRMLIESGNTIIANVPLVNKVYLGIQQILDVTVNNNKNLFDRAVLIEYPKENSWAVGFVTSRTTGEIPNKLGKELVSIFIPTTPNPTSGFLLFVPIDRTIELDMDIETAIKMIMSAGMVNDDQISKTQSLYTIPGKIKKWNWLRGLRRPKSRDDFFDPRD